MNTVPTPGVEADPDGASRALTETIRSLLDAFWGEGDGRDPPAFVKNAIALIGWRHRGITPEGRMPALMALERFKTAASELLGAWKGRALDGRGDDADHSLFQEFDTLNDIIQGWEFFGSRTDAERERDREEVGRRLATPEVARLRAALEHIKLSTWQHRISRPANEAWKLADRALRGEDVAAR